MASATAGLSYRLGASLAPDTEVIAFGDIHGCSDQLEVLLEAGRNSPRLRERRVVVFLGDLIDRGPDSVKAVALAQGAGARLGAHETVWLCGNHEQMLRIALADDLPDRDRLDAYDLWRHNGGRAVIRQIFGAAPEAELEDVAETLRQIFGPCLDRLVTHYHCGAITYVHAGLAPDLTPEDCLSRPWQEIPATDRRASHHWAWMRETFLNHDPQGRGHHGRFVVHGHSMMPEVDPVDRPTQIRRWRLNLDGGSYRTGRVLMAHMAGDDATLFEARAGAL